ncbi:MAG: hypothetical protein QNI97_06080, partial [Desulfobacterales bacterium]|nr:hypothetical protein [Desulfobacterales bacterium]
DFGSGSRLAAGFHILILSTAGVQQTAVLFGTAGVAGIRRGFQERENAGLGRRMPFMDGHYVYGP